MIVIAIKVTIGLCVKDSRDTVQTAIQSVSNQDYPHEALKLVIVNEEKDEQARSCLLNYALQTDVRTSVFSNQGKGLGAARQTVVDNAEGDYILWVDDDFVLEKDFIRQHVEFMDKNPHVGAALAYEAHAVKTLVTILESYLRVITEKMNTPPNGSFEIFRIKAVKEVGGYDVNIKGAGEDLDLYLKISKSGWATARNATSKYFRKSPPSTFKALWRKHFWYGYGNHYLSHKYKIKSHWDLYPPVAFAVGLRDALKIYPHNLQKKVFLLPLYLLYRTSARLVGYTSAHFDGYGNNISM